MFDLIIIGAGPIGLACSIEAKKKKLKSLILEKGVLVNSIYNYPQNMTFFSTSDKLEIGEVPFISQNPKPTRPEALEYYRRVCTSWDLEVNLYETVIKIDSQSEIFNSMIGSVFLLLFILFFTPLCILLVILPFIQLLISPCSLLLQST